MNTAACVVSDTKKFNHGLAQILHDDLHWLDVADRVTYKPGVIMHRCQHGKAPQYLVDCCTPVTDVVGRQRIRSATQQHWWWWHDIGYPLLDAEHLVWSVTLCQMTSVDSRTMSPLDRAWKPGFSPDTSVFSTLETFVIIVLYKSTFTIPYHTETIRHQCWSVQTLLHQCQSVCQTLSGHFHTKKFWQQNSSVLMLRQLKP